MVPMLVLPQFNPQLHLQEYEESAAEGGSFSFESTDEAAPTPVELRVLPSPIEQAAASSNEVRPPAGALDISSPEDLRVRIAARAREMIDTAPTPTPPPEMASSSLPPHGLVLDELEIRSVEAVNDFGRTDFTIVSEPIEEAPSDRRGMTRAQPSPWMKNAPEIGRNKPSTRQELPTVATPVVSGAESTWPVPAVPGESWMDSSREQAWQSSAAGIGFVAPFAADATKDIPAVSEQPAGMAADHVLQELRVAIPSHAIELRQSRSESMMVVLRPDSQTAIHLQLLGTNGTVDVQAQLERGNFGALSAQWNELRQTLADQGIHLGDLRDNGALSLMGGENSDGFPQPDREPHPPELGTFGEPFVSLRSPPSKSRTAPAPASNAAGRSWESWA
ncbi:MAG: hypothetical protein QOF48_3087 [Verrucomicrobiota bacterium]